MQNCCICYEDQETTPLFFKCVVCEEGKCCFKCYKKMTCNTSNCPVCQAAISSFLNGQLVFGFVKFQFGVNEKNAKLISIVNLDSPLIAYLKEHRLAFELSEKEDSNEETTPAETCTIQYDEYHDIIDKEFPDCPFVISLGYETLLTLDEPFCKDDPEMIIIRDTRVSSDTFGFYETVKHVEDVADCELEIYKHHDKFPITLRQVITQMSTSNHYDNGYVIQDDHRFLEQFAQEEFGDYPVFSTWFGS